MSTLDLNTVKSLMAARLDVSPAQITDIEVVSVSPNKNDARRKNLRYTSSVNQTIPEINFKLKASISSPVSSNETSITLRQFFKDNSSAINQYFSYLKLAVVSVDVYVDTKEVTTSGDSWGTFSTSSSTAQSNPNTPTKSGVDKYFLYVVIGVPSLVLVGAVAGIIFVIFWRNRNAARRKTHWDMQNMYSGISMVDYNS